MKQKRGLGSMLVPQEIISKWAGAESGFRGIITGTVLWCAGTGWMANTFFSRANLV